MPTAPPPTCRARLALAAAVAALLAPAAADAVDIEGVQPVSLDQPRVYMTLTRPGDGEPLAAQASPQDLLGLGAIAGLPDDPDAPVEVAAIQAFLDTGASGILLSKPTADGLGVTNAEAAGEPVTYEDVGVGGTEAFAVSEPLVARVAPFSSATDGSNDAAYGPPVGPVRVQVRKESGMLDMLTGGVDVAGMPLMAGRVMVLDARGLDDFDLLKTRVVDAGDPTIPPTDTRVALSYVDFDRFTRLTPDAAEGPVVHASPLIGPHPFDATARHLDGQPVPPVTISMGDKTADVTMLLDTGAAASMISTAAAEKVGVTYADDGSTLLGVPKDQQFSLPIGGVGGQSVVSGFFLDAMVMPTREGDPVRYVKAPVLVKDITVTDATTGEEYTLEGLLGMNFLVASAYVTGGLLPDLGDMNSGAYTDVVIDHSEQTLGLKFR